MIKVGIVGGSGYGGSNLIRILSRHNYAKIKNVVSTSHAGEKVSAFYPDIGCGHTFSELSAHELNKMDVVFLAMPHGNAGFVVQKLNCKVIDLSADHRLKNTYGLPEVFRKDIMSSRIVANPGCYATACILAAYPLKDMIKSAVFDCISGYSGGGKNADYDYKENIIAYNLANHFHTNEISRVLNFGFSFSPHVVNTFRGIMCTAHLFLNDSEGSVKTEKIKERYAQFYKGTFTKVVDNLPCTKDVSNTPYCHIGGFEFDKNNSFVIISVLDNLLKGAASQAVENMNLMFNLKHKEGLE